MTNPPLDRPPLTDAQRIISRTWSQINNGTARGWSLAMATAADTMQASDTPLDAAEGDERDDSRGSLPRVFEAP